MLAAVRDAAVVDEHTGAAGLHDGCAGLHHRPRALQRAPRAAQDHVHFVAIDRRQLRLAWRPPAGGPKNLGKLVVGLQGVEFDLRSVGQSQRFGRQAAAGGQALDQLPWMRPGPRNAEIGQNQTSWFSHVEDLANVPVRCCRYRPWNVTKIPKCSACCEFQLIGSPPLSAVSCPLTKKPGLPAERRGRAQVARSQGDL
jgi:hypothetical protein